MHRIHSATGATTGRIVTRVYSDAAKQVPDWGTLSRPARWLALRPPSAVTIDDCRRVDHPDTMRLAQLKVAPDTVEPTTNTTTDGLQEVIVSQLNPTDSASGPSHLALGDGGDSGTDASNTELNNEQERVVVTQHRSDGRDLFTSTFVDSTQANGVDIDEVGLVTSDDPSDDKLLNHSTIQDIEKDSNTTATIDVILQFRPA